MKNYSQSELSLFTKSEFLKDAGSADINELHYAVSKSVITGIFDKWEKSRQKREKERRACYFSAEFLIGRMINNNLLALNASGECTQLLQTLGFKASAFEEIEDAAFGNGGLGRLAACFLDSGASLNLNLDGYGIRYKYGLFKQKIENGAQKEYVDDWMKGGEPWSIRRSAESQTIHFADETVTAVPYDMPIIGYKLRGISTLRLWQAESTEAFDFGLFNSGDYETAMKKKNSAENISRVLYPNDSSEEGRILRLKQQYFFSSASLKDLIKSFKQNHSESIEKIGEYVSIQLNDTHPVISIPEFIRLALQEPEITFEKALAAAKSLFNYTNHTVMPEALEKWELSLIEKIIPECAEIIKKTDGALLGELKGCEKAGELAIIQGTTVHMANLAFFVCARVNGVAKIHTDILKSNLFADWHKIHPEKILNITNGITPRRWLALCNPELCSFLGELSGGDPASDLSIIANAKKYAADSTVTEHFAQIKRSRKSAFSNYALKKDGVKIDPSAIFDVQIKRLHEYKRQLLNALAILELRKYSA